MEQNSRKRTKQNGGNKLIDAEFKTLVIRMLTELSENLNSLKEIQSETKDIPVKIKNSYRKSTVEWMK